MRSETMFRVAPGPSQQSWCFEGGPASLAAELEAQAVTLPRRYAAGDPLPPIIVSTWSNAGGNSDGEAPGLVTGQR